MQTTMVLIQIGSMSTSILNGASSTLSPFRVVTIRAIISQQSVLSTRMVSSRVTRTSTRDSLHS